ncbi:MAG: hypothetical protein ACHP84_07115, partial [Caulobacterales bacterium]
PPPPPPPPTDPTAIAVLSVLEHVCIPGAAQANLAQAAKAAGFRKSGDNWVVKTKDYTLTVEPTPTSPNQCHVDVTHPIDLEAPGRPIVVALHDWAVIARGWSLYRNDKNVVAGQEFTTRSWENTQDGNHGEALVFVTIRKADGTPSARDVDTSQLIYSVKPS